MKVFWCDHCGSVLFFESVQCVKCGHALGFLPDVLDLSSLEPADNGAWRALTSQAQGRLYRPCANEREHQVCNWLVPVEDPEPLCTACRLNNTIPDLSAPGNRERWHKLERAKRRVIYTLLHLRLPMAGVPSEGRPALTFNFLGETPGEPPVLTGHSRGSITVSIAEADDVERERRRVHLNEPLRTLLGHLRHEVAHYYWDRLIAGNAHLGNFRELFGDETRDYTSALQQYYQNGAPADWHLSFVTAYASAHPWEDWAETWAHYLHMMDSLETAASVGMVLRPKHPDAKSLTSNPKSLQDPTRAGFETILENWVPLTCAINELNRGMGQPDLYPFVLSTRAIEKLRFVHEVTGG